MRVPTRSSACDTDTHVGSLTCIIQWLDANVSYQKAGSTTGECCYTKVKRGVASASVQILRVPVIRAYLRGAPLVALTPILAHDALYIRRTVFLSGSTQMQSRKPEPPRASDVRQRSNVRWPLFQHNRITTFICALADFAYPSAALRVSLTSKWYSTFSRVLKVGSGFLNAQKRSFAPGRRSAHTAKTRRGVCSASGTCRPHFELDSSS